jgi:hypothetical protein
MRPREMNARRGAQPASERGASLVIGSRASARDEETTFRMTQPCADSVRPGRIECRGRFLPPVHGPARSAASRSARALSSGVSPDTAWVSQASDSPCARAAMSQAAASTRFFAMPRPLA